MAIIEPAEDIVELAKRHLDYPRTVKDEATLKEYIKQLENHVEQYPRDTNFSIKLEPKTGFGVVTCLESGCRKEKIKLLKRLGARDGGKSIGLGSLSPYRVHIQQAMHIESRNARIAMQSTSTPHASPVKAEQKTLSMSPEKRQRIAQSLAGSPYKAKPSSSQPTTPARVVSAGSPHPTGSVPGPSRPSGARGRLSLPVKLEPLDPPGLLQAPLMKRKSSISLNSLQSEEDQAPTPDEYLPQPRKVAKTERATPPRTTPPFLPAPKPFSPGVRPASRFDAEEARDQLNDVERGLRQVQQSLNRAEDKEGKTKADMTRMNNLTKTRDELTAERNRINGMFEVEATRARPTINAAQHPVASGSNVQLPNLAPVKQEPPTFNDVAYGLPQLQRPVASRPKPRPVAQRQSLAMTLDGEAYHVGAHAKHNIPPPTPGGGPGWPAKPEPDNDEGVWGDDLPAALQTPMYRPPLGAGANQHDINQFVIEAGNAETFDQTSSVSEALEKLGLPNMYEPLPGMNVALMAHQAIGVAWMLEKERQVTRRGGILADEMGLGKTVQMIALMAKNRPPGPADQVEARSTLIVAPLSLLEQWYEEIEQKTNMGLRIVTYHGTNKPKKLEVLQKYDIVLTTYHTLMLDWPNYAAQSRKKKRSSRGGFGEPFLVDDMADMAQDEREALRKKRARGLLYKMKVISTDNVRRFRVVLDEAQNIRNKESLMSMAVADLEAQHRWCLTGTPIYNALEDVYPYFRFLKLRPYYDWEIFRRNVLGPRHKRDPGPAMRQIQAIFKGVLLRRKKDSKLNGEPLIKLPSKTVELCRLEFSQEERDTYKMVESQSQAIFNRFLRQGTVLKNYFTVLVMLLRLRQICSHASLITEEGYAFMRPGEEAEDSDRNSELLRAEKAVGPAFVRKMQIRYQAMAASRAEIAARLEPGAADAELNEENDDEGCPICLDVFEDPVVTACEHLFCRNCIARVIDAFQPVEGDEQKFPHCPSCRADIHKGALFSWAIFERTEMELRDEDVDMLNIARSQRRSRRITRGRHGSSIDVESMEDSEDEEIEDDDDNLSDFIVEDDDSESEKDARREAKRRSRASEKVKGKRAVRKIVVDSDDEYDGDIIHGAKPDFETVFTPDQIKALPSFLPSTKMKHMMELLRKIAEEHPEEKILVISQWTQCLDLVSNYLTENGFLHVKYQGNMSIGKRSLAVSAFKSKDKATIMLMSQKCGGVGLNLTRANHVISLDLAWSNAVEQQAYDRVHRLGQTRPVLVRRLVIANTIEDRILQLQDKKQALADGSLGEGGATKLGRLSVEEMAALLNLNPDGTVIQEY